MAVTIDSSTPSVPEMIYKVSSGTLNLCSLTPSITTMLLIFGHRFPV